MADAIWVAVAVGEAVTVAVPVGEGPCVGGVADGVGVELAVGEAVRAVDLVGDWVGVGIGGVGEDICSVVVGIGVFVPLTTLV
jgi:hypothetical protein